MPYITPLERNSIGIDLPDLCSAGQLNYAVTRVVHDWIEHHGKVQYKTLNTAIGVLECAKLELYRQIVAPYEREKHKLNGPVSELDRDGQ